MRCTKCKTENPEGLKFCNECGTPFKTPCASCGFENAPAAKFCGQCGARLGAVAGTGSAKKSDQTPIDLTDAPVPENLEGERKTITVLFADIKGSMSQIEYLDPEAARAIVDPALTIMAEAVNRYQGHVAQSTGDGVFALFGAPIAYEDHPQRAIYAALRMQEELRRYSDRLRADGKAPVEIRIGINTGEVVMRSVGKDQSHSEYLPAGHAVGLASRLQTLAPTGAIAVSEHTRGLVEGYFKLKSLGSTPIKGVTEAVSVYEVIGLGPLRTRLQLSASRGLSRFVGRDAEISQMKRALEHAKLGHGQIVAAMAEPGIGKSRLFFEFKAVAQSGCMVLEAFSISHGKATAYLPVLDLLHGYFKLTGDDDQRERREKVGGKVLMLDRSLEDTIPYLFALLGIVDGTDPLAQMDAQIKKRRTLDAIKRILLRESLNQPLIVIFEDLHWIDGETQALLNLLAESIATAKLLLLVNYRPEYHHEWGSKTYYSQLRLDPLGKESAEEMLSAKLGDSVEFTPLKRVIIEKTEGNPFFIEEMVLGLFDEGALVRNGAIKLAKSLSQLKIPPTVQAILTSRIDRLPSDQKEVLQTLAVIGKDFPLGLVRSVTQKADDELDRMLSELQLGEFIYEQPAFPEPEYTFKHALTLEVVYGSLLIERREQLHELTARQIESLFQARLEDHYGALAYHYRRSANRPKAVEYLRLAGQQAVQRSATAEAIDHLSSALEVLRTLPNDNPVSAGQELVLETMLGPALIAAKGNAAPEVGVAYGRAVELGRRVGEGARLFPVVFGLRSFHMVRGELRPASELAEQLMTLAENLQDRDLLVEAHLARGNSHFVFGEFIAALENIERAIDLYDPQKHRVHAFVYGLEPGVFCLARCGWGLALLGHLDQATKKIGEAVALARQQSHPLSLAFALNHASMIHCERGEWAAGQEQAEAAIALCAEHGFAGILAHSTCHRGFALAGQGQEEGIALIRRGVESSRATGASLFHTLFLGLLAEACRIAGRCDEGVSALTEAIATVEKTSERFYEAELYRLKGELLGAQDPSNAFAAERSFREAIDVARRQCAKTLELRATTSLARFLGKQDRCDQARAMLAEIYNWFTESFDTAHLRDAKAVLDLISR